MVKGGVNDETNNQFLVGLAPADLCERFLLVNLGS